MTAIEVSSYAGLTAMTLLTLNILIGLIMSVKYNPVREWPHRRINTFKIHNWTAYIALSVAVLHPVIIPFSSTAHFTLIDILYPVNAPRQPWINVLGALALYSPILVVVTSYFQRGLAAKPGSHSTSPPTALRCCSTSTASSPIPISRARPSISSTAKKFTWSSAF